MGAFRVRSLTTQELRLIRIWLQKDEGDNLARAHEALVVRCLVDENNEPLYRPTELDQGVLSDWDSQVTEGLGVFLETFTGFDAQVFSIEAIEDLAGN